MSCANVIGQFNSGRLTSDEPGPIPNDPFLTFSIVGSQLKGQFEGLNEPIFDVTCTNIGRMAVVTFTRVQTDGTTTEYTGLVTFIPARRIVRIRGRFQRTIPSAVSPTRTDLMLSGDWETEKPT